MARSKATEDAGAAEVEIAAAASAPEDEQVESAQALPASRPSYAGLPIVKRQLNFGIGGTLEIPDEIREALPRSMVTIQAEAKLGSAKHTFLEEGVSEQVVLTIQADSVRVLEVKPPEPKPQQGTIEEALEDELGALAQEPALEEGGSE